MICLDVGTPKGFALHDVRFPGCPKMTALPSPLLIPGSAPLAAAALPAIPAARSRPVPAARRGATASADPDDEEEELGDEEDLSVAQPAADEDSAFDDFDDEFDDDFEEEEDDPDWDHPDDGEGDTPPAGKGPARKR
jgi:hypothetical protein